LATAEEQPPGTEEGAPPNQHRQGAEGVDVDGSIDGRTGLDQHQIGHLLGVSDRSSFPCGTKKKKKEEAEGRRRLNM
jgi:hypothetical protein